MSGENPLSEDQLGSIEQTLASAGVEQAIFTSLMAAFSLKSQSDRKAAVNDVLSANTLPGGLAEALETQL